MRLHLEEPAFHTNILEMVGEMGETSAFLNFETKSVFYFN